MENPTCGWPIVRTVYLNFKMLLKSNVSHKVSTTDNIPGKSAWTNHIRTRSLAALVVLAMMLTAPNAKADDNRIVWAMYDYPPLFTLKNGMAPPTPAQLGQGIVNSQLAAIIALMPGYKHEFAVANARRVWADFEKGNDFCLAGAAKTPERERIAYFVPYTIVPGYGLAVREDNQRRVSTHNGAVNLGQLVHERPDLVGYIYESRSFGPEIDAILKDPGDNFRRVPVSAPLNLLRALDAGRMDYTIEFPFVLEYQRKQSTFQHSMVLLRLEEVPPTITGYLACTRNPWGKQVTTDLEMAVKHAAHTSTFRNAVREWMLPSQIEQLNDQMEKFYDGLETKPRQ
jgi:uncharacterized protein (TIGR02285 family)